MLLRLKLCLLGDGNVGKSSLKRRYFGQHFSKMYMPTMGADLGTKTISIDTKELGKTEFKLQIWDLAGQPMFKQVRADYYRGSAGALLIFDLNNRKSLENLENWLYELLRYSRQDNLSIIVVGNKSDIFYNPDFNGDNTDIKERVYSIISEFESSYSSIRAPIKYYETSALTGENVHEAFEEICMMVFRTYYESIL